MIIKSPSKRVSHLNLKFLDLKIRSIPSQYCETTPIPDSHLPNISYHRNQVNSVLDLSQAGHDTSLNKINSIYRAHKNNYSRADDLTNDITECNQGPTISILQDNNQLCSLDAEQVLQYLSVDSRAMFADIDKSSQAKKDQNKQQYHTKNGPIDQQIFKYSQKIKTIQKENKMIHDEIYKIHALKLNDKGLQTKNVRNMRVLADKNQDKIEKHCLLQQHMEDLSQTFRYQSSDQKQEKLKKRFLDQFKNSQCKIAQLSHKQNQSNKTQDYSISKQNQQRDKLKRVNFVNSLKSMKQNMKVGLPFSKTDESILGSNRTKQNKKIGQKSNGINLPYLMKNKYEHFYEDLYKDKEMAANENNEEAERLNELKKKMISNNFDKNFEIYLQQRKMRVPEFLKNIR